MNSLKQYLPIVPLLFLMSCTKTNFATESAEDASSTTTTTASATPTPTPTPVSACGSSSSPTAALTASTYTLESYAEQVLSAPVDLTLTVNLSNDGANHYPGTIHISYVDNGILHDGSFIAPAGDNISIDTLNNNGEVTAEYNTWTTAGAFSGFFQDAYGALVLTVSAVDSSGCASGSVYYKNFTPATIAQSPYRMCWFLTAGPYDCYSSAIATKSSLSPVADGYTLLGTFSALPGAAAFQ